MEPKGVLFLKTFFKSVILNISPTNNLVLAILF